MIFDIKELFKKGFVHIFSASFINKIIQFGITIILVRILTKFDYGNFVYAQNILNMFLLLQGLGTTSAVLQFCSENNQNYGKRISYVKFGLRIALIFNFFIGVLIIIFSNFYRFPFEASKKILISLSLIPLISIIYDIVQVYLRAILKNKQFSILATTNSALYLIGNIGLGIYFSVKGIIASKYVAYVITVLLGLKFFGKDLKDILRRDNKFQLDFKEKKIFFKFALVASVTNAVSQMLYLLDTLLVGNIMKDSNIVAIYKTATLIPFNLTFIPMAIMTFAYPYFAMHYKDKKWIREKYNKLQLGLLSINAMITLVLVVFAPLVIKIIFGGQYIEAVTPFRILCLGYFISGTFRIPGGNVLFSIKKVQVNFYNSIASGIANIILDVILIKKWGYNGAAIATVLVFLISSIISNFYLYKYLKQE